MRLWRKSSWGQLKENLGSMHTGEMHAKPHTCMKLPQYVGYHMLVVLTFVFPAVSLERSPSQKGSRASWPTSLRGSSTLWTAPQILSTGKVSVSLKNSSDKTVSPLKPHFNHVLSRKGRNYAKMMRINALNLLIYGLLIVTFTVRRVCLWWALSVSCWISFGRQHSQSKGTGHVNM